MAADDRRCLCRVDHGNGNSITARGSRFESAAGSCNITPPPGDVEKWRGDWETNLCLERGKNSDTLPP